MKKFLKNRKLFAFLMALIVSVATFATPLQAAHAADPTSTPASSSTSKDVVNGAFDNGGTLFQSTEGVVKKAGGSLKSLITTIAIIVLVISVIFVGMQFTSKNSAKRQEAKANLGAIVVGAVLIFAAVAVISLSGTIADSLSTSVEEGINKNP